ncbi:MAG: hypothetical protein JNL87_09525 [Burkholderiaceae bacterium]|nr:hypothetical protein [Burkholderiaceae bacterium]
MRRTIGWALSADAAIEPAQPSPSRPALAGSGTALTNTPDSDTNDDASGKPSPIVAVFETSAGPLARSPVVKPSVGSSPETSRLATKWFYATCVRSPVVLKVRHSSGSAVELARSLSEGVFHPTQPATWSVSA